MKHFVQISRIAILLSVFIATISFAKPTILINFQNCTKQNVTVDWVGYNFNFEGDIGKNENKDGSFVIPPGSLMKTLSVYLGAFSDASLTAHLTGGVTGDFKVVDNMNIILGGINYITASDKISFEYSSNNALRFYARNTIKIGC